ncbi:hypothetical protein Sjap_004702 [Stephania japonica]|uniref:Uncharacterized protein n=1 Tax=Stephania japonica TaxID=461633 RepID=A0AAP0K3Z4_9MAGN
MGEQLLPLSAPHLPNVGRRWEALWLAGQGPVSPDRPPEAELGHGGVALDHPSLPLPYFGISLGPAAATVGLSPPSSAVPGGATPLLGIPLPFSSRSIKKDRVENGEENITF